MHQELKKIKKYEGKSFVIKKFLTNTQIRKIKIFYKNLPVEIDNKRQKIVKKKWPLGDLSELQKIFLKKLKKKIGNCKIDNPKTKEGYKSFGLFQESYRPVGLHVDTGFNFKKILFKQFLLPLTAKGETIIFKNRFYGCSTTFSIDPKELRAKGYNKRSSQHLKIFKGKNFDIKNHKKYLKHENIKNLKGLEIEKIYKWKLGEILIFDRSQLHCSSSNLKNKKIGFTGLTCK
ncbi:hypothetical protein OAM15_00910 [Pelagibacteraceae bacterium]|nr:hypothetical protein [Pelagibacteraceae bacterium]|tara:strand:- start:2097 stop:2792 length:696 start_codon:yes stop_codon:yes gene_type:complete